MKSTTVCRLATLLAVLAAIGIAIPDSARAGTFPSLNDPATGSIHQGKFVWVDLFTGDPVAAANFYSKLFGWTVTSLDQKGRSYLVLRNGERPVAGVVTRPGSSRKRLSRWIPYISVSDINATVAKVSAAGGVVHAPVRNFPDRGFQAIVGDSGGSVVGLLQSASGDALDSEPGTGEWNWFELYGRNPQADSAFYGQVFGYAVAPETRSERKNDFELSSDGHARAGVAPVPGREDSSPGWLPVVRIADIDAAVAQVSALGGEVELAPRAASLGSRFAVISDPTGGTVGLVQYVDNSNPADHR
jgi:predicted enzyme related to lactoylglutathione lyase